MMLAFITALLALSIALFLGYVNRNSCSVINRFLVRFVSMGYAIPGTVVAVGVLIPFVWIDNRLDEFLRLHFSISSGLLISGTLFILVFAYLVRFLAVSINTVEAALGKIKPEMDEIAKTNGLSQTGIVKKIHMPIMKGSLLTALLLVMVPIPKA